MASGKVVEMESRRRHFWAGMLKNCTLVRLNHIHAWHQISQRDRQGKSHPSLQQQCGVMMRSFNKTCEKGRQCQNFTKL